ncbi:MAG TPA: ATPase, partial [Xanthomonadales bacterium]|nr:ATPase [Xanthomonadales bacterium]
LSRALLRLPLGYPDPEAEREMLAGADRRELIAQSPMRLSSEDVLDLRRAVQQVHASPPLGAYVQALLAESRRRSELRAGLSPRAGLALLNAARAHALLVGRDHVAPDDVQALFEAVAAHRLVPEAETDPRERVAQAILRAVAVD